MQPHAGMVAQALLPQATNQWLKPALEARGRLGCTHGLG